MKRIKVIFLVSSLIVHAWPSRILFFSHNGHHDLQTTPTSSYLQEGNQWMKNVNSSLITIRYVYLISTSFPQGPARVRWSKRIWTIFALCNYGEMGNKVLLDYLPCLSCYFYRSIKIFLNVLFTCLNRIVRHVEIFLQSARWIMGELKSRYLGFGGKRSFHQWNLLFRYQNFQWQWVILMKLPGRVSLFTEVLGKSKYSAEHPVSLPWRKWPGLDI